MFKVDVPEGVDAKYMPMQGEMAQVMRWDFDPASERHYVLLYHGERFYTIPVSWLRVVMPAPEGHHEECQ